MENRVLCASKDTREHEDAKALSVREMMDRLGLLPLRFRYAFDARFEERHPE